jgi:general secretion pathway protein E
MPGYGDVSTHAEVEPLVAVVPSLVEHILSSASRAGASDVHFELGDRMMVRVRRDGMLRPAFAAPGHIGRLMMGRLRALGKIPLCRAGNAESSFSLHCDHAVVRVRLSLIAVVGGEKAVVRFLNRGAHLQLRQLGMLARDLDRYDRLIRSPGLVLIAGPAGSGKTTTLYASLERLAHPGVNVVSLEDPVEMTLPGVVQIGVDHGLTGFQSCLAAVMRQDPDVIAIGEIRDHDSAIAAVRAALTGRTTLASIHAEDGTGAAYRLTDLGIPHPLAGAAVVGAVSQRLVRTTCPACRGTGCARCGQTGYDGRTGVFEVLSLPPRLSGALAAGAPLEAARSIRMGLDQPSLSAAAEQAVTSGLTAWAEVSGLVEGGHDTR